MDWPSLLCPLCSPEDRKSEPKTIEKDEHQPRGDERSSARLTDLLHYYEKISDRTERQRHHGREQHLCSKTVEVLRLFTALHDPVISGRRHQKDNGQSNHG